MASRADLRHTGRRLQPRMKSYRHYLRRVVARLTLGSVVTVVVPLLVVVLWLRFFGLPDSAKVYLLGEIQRRHIFPFPVTVDRLLLDPTGAVLARGVTVYRDTDRRNVMLEVDQVRVSFAWLSWWRGTGLLDSASISNAAVRYPVGQQETADFHQVNAQVAFAGHDIKIEDAGGRFDGLAISIRGTIHNDGFAPAKPLTEAEREAQKKTWQSVLHAMGDIGAAQPIDVQLEFETSTRDLAGGRANFTLEGRQLTWRMAPVEEISIHGSLSDGVVELSDFKIGLARGELDAYGEWNLAARNADLTFTSTMDVTSLAPAFPGAAGAGPEPARFLQRAAGHERDRPLRSVPTDFTPTSRPTSTGATLLSTAPPSTASASRLPTTGAGCSSRN